MERARRICVDQGLEIKCCTTGVVETIDRGGKCGFDLEQSLRHIG
ncbi:hypothetical protein SLEP1_g39666 [Rubroshorea leprosula]|uniref:Uncharacterized protein n=1 Tax=Rubroshorea leprosula TaxID=152421 RepID=A0AAV5L0Y6_9ROSI|nr:hypothetical protein SLEP1_g39666 [Rubroshorea leprosula]